MWIIYHFLRLACAKEWTSFNEQFNRIDSQFVFRIAPKWQAKQAKYMQKENSTQTCLICQYQSKVDSNYKLLTDHTQNRTKYLHWTERKENEAVEKNVVLLLSKTFRSGRKHALRNQDSVFVIFSETFHRFISNCKNAPTQMPHRSEYLINYVTISF